MIIHAVDQNSPEWMNLRAGIPTSSNAKLLCTSAGKPSASADGYAISLACEKFAGRAMNELDGAFGGNSHTERGHELEQDAYLYYEMLLSVDTHAVGFVTTDDGLCGSSPDRLVGDKGMAEVKCLKYDNHVKEMLYFQKHGKISSAYVPQVQDQMLVCERDWCDSIFYHPTLPPFIIRNEPIAAVRACLIVQKEYVCAERDRVYSAILKQA